MVIIDYIILLLILGSAILGYRKGFLRSLGSILGIIIAAVVASRFYPTVAGWFGDSNLYRIIAFIIIFLVAIKLVSLLFWLIGKVFQIVTVLPFVSGIDSILGFILGTVEGIFTLSVITYFLSKYPVHPWLTSELGSSLITTVLLKIVYIFMPFFPEALKTLKSIL